MYLSRLRQYMLNVLEFQVLDLELKSPIKMVCCRSVIKPSRCSFMGPSSGLAYSEKIRIVPFLVFICIPVASICCKSASVIRWRCLNFFFTKIAVPPPLSLLSSLKASNSTSTNLFSADRNISYGAMASMLCPWAISTNSCFRSAAPWIFQKEIFREPVQIVRLHDILWLWKRWFCSPFRGDADLLYDGTCFALGGVCLVAVGGLGLDCLCGMATCSSATKTKFLPDVTAVALFGFLTRLQPLRLAGCAFSYSVHEACSFLVLQPSAARCTSSHWTHRSWFCSKQGYGRTAHNRSTTQA